MKTIVITSQKGGSGKTTLAASLSVAAEQAKDGPVVIIDTDPQNTLATWWNARDAETPQLAHVTLRELPQKIADLAAAGFAYCFIDTPPALTEHKQCFPQGQSSGVASRIRKSAPRPCPVVTCLSQRPSNLAGIGVCPRGSIFPMKQFIGFVIADHAALDWVPLQGAAQLH